MKKTVLFVNDKKMPVWFKGIEKEYSVIAEKDSLTAFKKIIAEVPDIVIFNMSESVFDGYQLVKLIKNTEETSGIPVVIVSNKKFVLPCMNFEDCTYIDADMNKDDVKDVLDNLIKTNKVSKTQKASILKLKLTSAQLKSKIQTILDEVIVNSSITEEFKKLIDTLNYEDVLSANIFEIIKRYLDFDFAGLFFNQSDEFKRNIFNLALPNNNIDIPFTEKIRDEFFDVMEKHKVINDIQCDLIMGDVVEKSKLTKKSLKTEILIPYFSTGTLTGGFYLSSAKKLDLCQTAFLNIIVRELDVIFKLKYLFNEHISNALIDPMTRLFNKQEFEADIEKEFHRARRYIFNFTLAMLDVDYLSKINEKYGREFGDFVLTELSKVLKEVFRRTDIIYRYGGEEIIVLLPSTPIEKSLIPIERLREKIAHHLFEKDNIKTNITVSVGLCANYSQFTQPEQLVSSVEAALLRAKERGRNCVDIFEDI